jgi:AcrR family transcriptional regulator
MDAVDQVRTRPGGRSARVRERVLAAVREAVESGDTDALSIDELARRSGVHRATIYRRWLSTAGLFADLLLALTPVETPLPDTGNLRQDLAEVANRVAATLATAMSATMLPMLAASTEPHVVNAAAAYWSNLFTHTAQVVRRAQARGDAAPGIDPVAAIESLLAPIYLRTLVSRQPITPGFLTDLADRTARMLHPG